MSDVRIVVGDCRDVLRGLDAESVDAIVTDPPYGLEFMGKEWDRLDDGLPQASVWKGRRGKGGSHVGADDSKPSSRHHVAYGVKKSSFKRCTVCGKRAFSGSPCVCDEPIWTIEYPDGAPSSAIRMQRWHESWAVEAFRVLKPGGHLLAFGGDRTVHRLTCALEDSGFEIRGQIAYLYGQGFPKSLNVEKALDPRTPEEIESGVEQDARSLAWRGWGTALKPAMELVVVARKPLIGTVAANVARYGTGALNIDGCRIGETVETWPASRSYRAGNMRTPGETMDARTESAGATPSGRWPANVALDEDAAAMLDAQSGTSRSGVAVRRNGNAGLGSFPVKIAHGSPDLGYGDTGGASRFFYTAKSSRSERNAGLDGLPEREGGCLEGNADRTNARKIEARPDVPVARTANHHPTVKPIALMRWLLRLVTPPGGLVVDPFAGSGTTGCAAALDGLDCLLIEQDAEYAAIAEKRVAHWSAVAVAEREKTDRQPSLF